MGDDRTSVMDKVTAMKKAGFHPVMILLITLASTPGLWERFIDDTDEKALTAIESAYPLLAKDAEDNTEARKRQAEINQKMLIELTRLQTKLDMIGGGSTAYALDGSIEDEALDVMEAMRGFGGGGSSGVGVDGSSAGLLPPEELFPAAADGDADTDGEGAMEPVGASDGEGSVATKPPVAHALPREGKKKSLDDLIQQQQEVPVRDRLPDLGELLGGKK